MVERLLGGALFQQEELVGSWPERIGRYLVLRPLGEGASSRVYLAQDPEIGRRVAVKLLQGPRPSLERFRQEMQVLGKLGHPNIILIHDSGLHAGNPYYVMEYQGERSLADPSLEPAPLARALESVARACHAAHEAGVVHRDLKPANILMGDRPVVADFGVAKLTDPAQALLETQEGKLVGTPVICPPSRSAGARSAPRATCSAWGSSSMKG